MNNDNNKNNPINKSKKPKFSFYWVYGAIALVFIQTKFGLFMITPSLAFPVEFKTENVVVVFFTILILGFIASKIASSRITKEILE